MFRRFAGAALAVALGWGGAFGAAAQTARLDQLETGLRALDCERGGPSVSADFALVMLTAYADEPVEALANRANITVAEFVLEGGSTDRADNGRAFVNDILNANAQVHDLILRSLARDGAELCPVLTSMSSVGLRTTVRRQEEERAYFRPQAAFAQTALNFHGCGAGRADGLFGPGSRAAWGRLGQGELPDGAVPPPSLVARIWAGLDGGMGCAGVTADLSAVRETAQICLGGDTWGASAPRLGWALAAATGQNPDAIEPLMRAIFGLCRAELLKDWEDEPQSFTAGSVFASYLAALPPLDHGERMAVAEALFAALDPEPGLGDLDAPMPEAPINGPRLVSSLASDLFLGQNGLPERRDLGAIILTRSDSTDLYSAGPGRAILDGMTRGLLTKGLAPETLETIALAPQTSARMTDAVLPDDPVERVRALLNPAEEWMPEVLGPAYADAPTALVGGAQIGFGTTIEGINAAVALADAVQESPAASDALARDGSATANAGVGTLLFEGNTRLGADRALARRHFAVAADKGDSYALYRIGLMEEAAGATDVADVLYRRAVDAGQPAAAMRLAELALAGEATADDATILAWLRHATGLDRARPVHGAAAPLLGLMRDFPEAADAGPLADVLEEISADALSLRDAPSYGAANIPLELARGFAGLVPGAPVDAERAVYWYRRALVDGREELIRFLAAEPQFMEDPGELERLAESSLLALYLSAPSPEAMSVALDTRCPISGAEDACVDFMAEAALGALPNQTGEVLLSQAVDWLDRASAEERRIFSAPRAEQAELWSFTFRSARASQANARVLGFYGDVAAARRSLLGIPTFGQSWNAPSPVLLEITDAAFRRAAVRRGFGGDQAAWAPVETLLQELAQRGDERADAILELASAEASVAEPAADLEAARLAFELSEPLFPAAGLSANARRLSVLEEAAGDALRAAELEMRAFGADLARHAATERRLGALHATMGRVCSYSRASERLFSLGQEAIALILAKQAVNDLQALRARLRGLPEELQMCFRDSVAGHYRWLADLFISLDRPAEATAVLQMLKSFETFEFLDSDEEYRGVSLEELPLSDNEGVVLSLLTSHAAFPFSQTYFLPPSELPDEPGPVGTNQAVFFSLARERRALLIANRDAELSDAEMVRLGELNEIFREERIEREAALVRLAEDARDANQSARVDAVDAGKQLKSLLNNAYDKKAAALYYVVLPNRMAAVLTTPLTEQVFTWETLDGAPFTEAGLDAKVEDLRMALSQPSGDPRALAQEMYDLLLPNALAAEIAESGVDTLLVSPDRQLRYLPFAALHDGEAFLVEKLDVVHVTEARSGRGGAMPNPDMAAFGTTRGWYGFSPLPGVRQELEALVGADGIFAGTPRLDGDFTRDRLASSLFFPEGSGILHLASHFKLAESEQSSFLLLGDGGQLSIRDIKEGLDIDLDFAEVSLLTLSACDTGFGNAALDGRELESFAAIAQEAGAATVVATLWPVADSSTARFMGLFYTAMAEAEMIPRHALSAAQRAFLQGADSVAENEARRAAELIDDADAGPPSLGNRHPFYWAPFVALEGTT
ncbi:MAG: CHAT domain-containing protein [Pseudomonadota bacterium]